jgi:hypothetical protein
MGKLWRAMTKVTEITQAGQDRALVKLEKVPLHDKFSWLALQPVGSLCVWWRELTTTRARGQTRKWIVDSTTDASIFTKPPPFAYSVETIQPLLGTTKCTHPTCPVSSISLCVCVCRVVGRVVCAHRRMESARC